MGRSSSRVQIERERKPHQGRHEYHAPVAAEGVRVVKCASGILTAPGPASWRRGYTAKHRWCSPRARAQQWAVFFTKVIPTS